MKKLMRRIALPLLQRFAMGVTIKHHWVPSQSVYLNSFQHKGYWYHGKKREAKTMELFSKLIKPGMTVAEVGGHIGYISIYFDSLVGETGRVVVFEPGQNNLPYTRKNLGQLPRVTLVEKGVGEKNETRDFYVESLTGQNNSFVQDFDGLDSNSKNAYVAVEKSVQKVELITLDTYFKNGPPDFIKVDVEGFEYFVLLGAEKILKSHPLIMVEVQSHEKEIFELFTSLGYSLFDENMVQLTSHEQLKFNVFCLHHDYRNSELKDLG